MKSFWVLQKLFEGSKWMEIEADLFAIADGHLVFFRNGGEEAACAFPPGTWSYVGLTKESRNS